MKTIPSKPTLPNPNHRVAARVTAATTLLCVLGGLAVSAPASAALPADPSGLVAPLVALVPVPATGLPAIESPAVGSPSIDDVVLNIGADDTQRALSWFTTAAVDGEVQVAPASAVATPGVFPESAATVIPATGNAAYTVTERYQHATLTALDPASGYVYRVGSEQSGWSASYSFTTESAKDPFSFLFMGDPQIGASGVTANDTAGWVSTVDTALGAFTGTDFILSAGDQVNTPTVEAEYDGFFAPDQLTSVPLATNIGNHDVKSSAYSEHFNMPNVSSTYGVGTAGESGGDYWFTHKGVLFLSLNSNDQNNDGHIAFLEETIAAHGDAAKWTVLAFHHSIYSAAVHAEDSDILARRAALSPAISALDIDLVLMGHDHVYVRTFLMDGTTPVSGTGGNSLTPKDGQVLYVTANSSSGSKNYTMKDTEFPYAAVQNQENAANYSNVEIEDNALTVTTYRSSDSSVVDTVSINRPAAE